MTPDPTTDPSRTVEHAAGDRTPPDARAAAAGGSSATVHAPSHVSLALAPFPVVAGYTITAEIARGGMGCVYAGHDLSLDREVAIKTLLPTANADRFVTEAKITARLPHPNIPPVYAFGRLDDGAPFLAMKFVRGRTLAAQLAARTSPADDLPRFVSIFEQVAQAVGFAHAQGVLHRDLKPANVMVGSFGEVQVMDWGLAKQVGANEEPSTEELAADSPTAQEAKTRAGQIMGTPAYMAPEQARGEVVDARADVFSLGAVLAVILTGRPAFVGDTVADTVAKAARGDLTDVLGRLARCGADEELVALARRCLSADAPARPANGQEVADAVAGYRAGVAERLRAAETARAVSAADAASARKRRRIVTLAAGGVIAVLTAGVAVSLVQMSRAVAAEANERGERVKAEEATVAAEQEKKRANEEEEKARQGELKERKEREKAERQQRIAEKTRQFLIDYFAGRSSWIGGATVGGPTGPNATLREVIEFAESRIDKEFAGFPEAEFDLHTTFASLQIMLNNPDGYERHAKRARELARELRLENSAAVRLLDASGVMFKSLRLGTLIPGDLSGLVQGSAVTSWNATPEGAAMNAHILKGLVAFQVRDFAATEKAFRAAVEVAEKAHGPGNPATLTARLLLALILGAADQTDTAQAEFDAVIAEGQKVEWGRTAVLLARAYSRALRVTAAADDGAVLALAEGLEQSKDEFDRLGMWDTEHGAMLIAALARLREAQKRPAEAVELLLRVYRAATKSALVPVCETAYRLALAYAALKAPREIEYYLTVAMNQPTWGKVIPADQREAARTLRGTCRIQIGRYADAEADLLPDIPQKLRGTPSEKFSIATLGAGLDKREYLKPYLDLVPALAARPDQQMAQTVHNLRNLAAIAQKERNFELAVDLLDTVLDISRKFLGPERSLDPMHERGLCYEALGRYEEAARDLRPIIEVSRQTYGDGGTETRDVCAELARVLGAGGKSAEEIALRKRTFEATRRALGDRPHATWEDAARLLTACRVANDYSAISPDAKTLPAALVALLGSDPNGLIIQRRTAAKMRPYAVATELLAALARSRFETFGELHPAATAAVVDLANLSREAGTPAAAVSVLERVVARMEKDGFQHPNASAWVNELADALEACSRAGDAEAWRRKWLTVIAGATGAESLATAGARAALGLNLLQQQKWEEAETVLRACLVVREKHAPNEWQTDNTRSMLGGALLGQKKFAEAEPLLRAGYEGMLKRESAIPAPGRPRLGEAVDRLIELATAKGDAEAVKRWKAERARYLEVAPVPRARN